VNWGLVGGIRPEPRAPSPEQNPGPLRGRVGLLALTTLLGSGCLHFHRGAMPGEPEKATYLEVEGARVRYLDVGEGPPVVLVHGFASSLETWLAVVPTLSKTHRVLALDLKGFGWTDRPEGDYSPAAQARIITALMDARGIEKAAVVAHSWGASVALALALQSPERVSRLALYDAWVYESQIPTFFHFARAPALGELLFGLFYGERSDERIGLAFYDQRFVTEQLVEEVEKSLERPGTRAAALAAVRGQRYADFEANYSKVAVPTLLLWGREDLTTPPAIGERLSRQLPNSKLIIYPRCGHFPMLEAAAESTRELAAFLGEPQVLKVSVSGEQK
jgi:pimeloyl-ACP methyl ester carboxylesterase